MECSIKDKVNGNRDRKGGNCFVGIPILLYLMLQFIEEVSFEEVI